MPQDKRAGHSINEAPPTEFRPLLCLNLWEHAYWTDYGHNREEYIRRFWQAVRWDRLRMAAYFGKRRF